MSAARVAAVVFPLLAVISAARSSPVQACPPCECRTASTEPRWITEAATVPSHARLLFTGAPESVGLQTRAGEPVETQLLPGPVEGAWWLYPFVHLTIGEEYVFVAGARTYPFVAVEPTASKPPSKPVASVTQSNGLLCERTESAIVEVTDPSAGYPWTILEVTRSEGVMGVFGRERSFLIGKSWEANSCLGDGNLRTGDGSVQVRAMTVDGAGHIGGESDEVTVVLRGAGPSTCSFEGQEGARWGCSQLPGAARWLMGLPLLLIALRPRRRR